MKRCFSMKEAVLFESKSTASRVEKHRFFPDESCVVNKIRKQIIVRSIPIPVLAE